MRPYETVLFDLDGTLTDPFLGITKSVRHSLRYYGIESELEPLKAFIGPPLYDSYMKYFGFTKEQAVEAVAHYREYYAVTGLFELTVFDGIPELLGDLKKAGYRLVVATSKPLVFTEKILDRYGLAEYFDYVSGCELDGTRVKKSEVIAWALTHTDCPKPLMVGDRLHDVEGAHENGLPCAGVLWGYGGADELRACHADYLLPDVSALRGLLLD